MVLVPGLGLDERAWALVRPRTDHSALRASLRCQPVVAHSSSRTVLFSVRPARLSRAAIVLVTACPWLIVSPITETHRYPVLQPGRHALRAHFSNSQRSHLRAHS